jgi:hypothetical protein
LSDVASGYAGSFSCVVDEHPRFHLDALRWFACLTRVAGVQPGDLVVHVVGSTESEVLDHLRGKGVSVVAVDHFDPRSPHCNKISGALRLAEQPIDGMAVLCDTDLAVLEDPRTIELTDRSIAAKPVDAPVPSLEVVLEVFAVAGLAAPPVIDLPWGSGDRTVAGNGNGGLYLVPASLLPRAASAWAYWARWLLDRVELLRQWSVYVDQVAMALALRAEGIDSVALGVRWNTPTHDAGRIPPDAPEPAIIHYHQEVDRAGLLKPTSSPSINHRIEVANRAIALAWSEAQPSRTHDQWLLGLDVPKAEAHPTDQGRAIAEVLLGALGPSSVLELGKPGHGVTAGLAQVTSARSEPSPEALRRTLGESGEPAADLTVALGILPRANGRDEYENLVRLLSDSAGKALLVSGWEDPATMTADEQRFFHEPLSDTLRRIAPGAEIYPVTADRLSTFVVLKPPTTRHPRDFSPATLDLVVERHPDPLALARLRLHARHTTGFYPDHAPRLWEYPVVADLIADQLPPGSRLVDVGAGVTPLAPFLTSLGFVVDTVESDWNEWDFLDYASAGLAHRSWNCTLGQLPVRPPFDGLYSISVIEHVPARERRNLLTDIALRVRLGGLVVLTIDLKRGSDRLWNRNLGIQVEELAKHGALADVVDECSTVGLELVHQDVVRNWGDTAVDIALLVLHNTGRLPASRRKGIVRRSLSKMRRQ